MKNQKNINNGEEFNSKIFKEFSISEIKNINTRIYLNKDHIEYFESYKMGEYNFCFEYLLKNRELLK